MAARCRDAATQAQGKSTGGFIRVNPNAFREFMFKGL
jgi:hypothetical protein